MYKIKFEEGACQMTRQEMNKTHHGAEGKKLETTQHYVHLRI